MKIYRRAFLFALILLIVGQACTLSLIEIPDLTGGSTTVPGSTPAVIGVTSTPPAKAQTTFIVTLPEPLAPGENLLLTILDEVTGLPYNPTYYPMQPRDSLTYTAVLPITLNSVVKYRYMRQGAALTSEDLANGKPVRYRMYFASGQGETHDIINDWADKNFNRSTGVVQGVILNSDTGAPVPNLLISLGGAQTITNSSGQFCIDRSCGWDTQSACLRNGRHISNLSTRHNCGAGIQHFV
jgi:hypothetical protein